MAQDSYLRSFMQKTGLSQENLATLLGVSRSSVNMDCRGERLLSTAAMLRFVQIEQGMQQMDAPEWNPFGNRASLVKKFAFRVRELRHKVAVMERFMEDYETRREQWVQREKMLEVMAGQHSEVSPSPLEESWFDWMKALQNRLPKAADRQYFLYKIQAPLMLQEADALERLLDEWKQPL